MKKSDTAVFSQKPTETKPETEIMDFFVAFFTLLFRELSLTHKSSPEMTYYTYFFFFFSSATVCVADSGNICMQLPALGLYEMLAVMCLQVVNFLVSIKQYQGHVHCLTAHWSNRPDH